MTPLDHENDPSEDPRLLELAREYLAELEAGRMPDRRHWLARCPDLALELGEAFDGIELAHAAGQGLRPVPSAVESAEPLGDFRIVREIGRGGMGVVYEAVQLSLGRRVALKVLPFAAGLDARQLQRFRTEAQAAAQLHHTNIVPVYAVGCERGTHFYAMQLIEGKPLDAFIRELRGGLASTCDIQAGTTPTATTRPGRGREVYRTAARIAAQVADALEYAHESGVVHRDIKPANLLLDSRGTVWVTDFGLAHIVAEVGPTRTGDMFGTLRYMSPEHAAGRRVQADHRADVYSLGATLYELLTLEPIFPGQNRQVLLHQILNEEPRRPRLVERGVPEELETIVLKALAKAPEDRYATAGEMAADLRRFLDEKPILARRPSLFERARKWLRRHPAYLHALLVLLVCGVVGLAVSTALIERERSRERQRAAEAEQRFQMARRSADEMILIAEQELSDSPVQQTLRRRLLDAALTYYQEFIELRRDDSEARVDLEQTQAKVRLILADLAVMQGAERHLLLAEPAVQDDLKLTSEQRGRLQVIFREISNPPRDARPRTRSERSQKLLTEMKAHEADIVVILQPAQFERLRQIALQTRGVSAFREPDVADALGLTREQREQMRELDFGMSGPHLGPREGPRSGSPHGRPDGGSLSRALALLTPQQVDRWRALTGEMFTGPLRGPHHGGRP